MRALAFLLITAFFLTYTSAYAQQQLRYMKAETYKQKQVVQFVRAETPESNAEYVLSPVDLNDDAIDEYIVRPKSNKNCPKKPLCPHKIVAFQDYKPIYIGSVDAHKILISDKKTYGIRHIIVYNQAHNDYAHTTMLWDPSSFRYQ